ncbi:MAG: BatA domain-containing protein [Gemmataceae bacterium]
MSFLAPALLFGSLAVAVPVVLHFFFKPRHRPVPWAAMTFLRKSLERTNRRLKVMEYVLLALRCLVLLLLALALARPTSTGTAGSGSEPVDAVFLFDTSYSMAAADGETTRLGRAQAAARAALENLPPESTVQIFGVADRVTPLGPVSPRNREQAREVIDRLTVAGLAGEVLPGLTEASAALTRGTAPNKEVYLFTDLQKSGWDGQPAAVRSAAQALKEKATVILVRCGDTDRAITNVAVTGLGFPTGIPHAGGRFPVTVVLRNTGPTPARKLTLTLTVDDRKQDAEAVAVPELPAGQDLPVTVLSPKLDTAGPRLLTAVVGPDDLPGDNRLDRIVTVRDRVRVLVIDGRLDAEDPKRSASHFVRNALVPVSADRQHEYFVTVNTVGVADAGPGLLGAADVCVLCDVPAAANPGDRGLNRAFADRLARFVRDGGGLIVTAGENVRPAEYNAVFGPTGANLLPFPLEDVIAAPADKPFKPAPDSAAAGSFLERFRDDPFRTITADVDVSKLVALTPGERPGSRVLLPLTDTRPLVAARSLGEGEVVFVATTLDPTWTNWPAKAGSYLAFARFALGDLTGRAGQGLNRRAGEPLVWHPPAAPRGFDLIRPDGKRVPLGKATGGADGQRLTVTATDTTAPGVYQMGLSVEDPPTGPRFAVTPDLRETARLDRFTDAEVEELVGFRPVMVAADPGRMATERDRREWTVWLLLAVFVVGLVEAVWAWTCGKAW